MHHVMRQAMYQDLWTKCNASIYPIKGFPTFFPVFLIMLLISMSVSAASSSTDGLKAEQYRTIIEDMKNNPRGPFKRIRWFCNDGTIHPPKPYPCAERGGGIQHAEWQDITKSMRDNGIFIANFLVETDIETLLTNQATTDSDESSFHTGFSGVDILGSILLEKFLTGFDDGWILRQAQFYRGAFQIEDEEASGRKILIHLLEEPEWLKNRFILLTDSARRLPHGVETTLIGKIRALAATINQKDERFRSLRSKIHGNPDQGDAQRVREFLEQHPDSDAVDDLRTLESDIKRLSESNNTIKITKSLIQILQQSNAANTDANINNQIKARIEKLQSFVDNQEQNLINDADQYSTLAETMRFMRETISIINSEKRLDAIDILTGLDQSGFVLLQQLTPFYSDLTRRQALERLKENVYFMYGNGLISAYELEQIEDLYQQIKPSLPLHEYRQILSYLEKIPVWAERRLQLFYAPILEKWHPMEPLVEQFIPDRLRSSHLLGFAALLERLTLDAGNLSGIQHTLLGEHVSTGLTRINPGLARGKLVQLSDLDNPEIDSKQSIVIVPETVAELAPVAGILTAFEGNQLSHVQLLARNLGVPNIVVGSSLMEILSSKLGEEILVAASPGGIVNIDLLQDSHRSLFDQNPKASGKLIQVNVEKLDLDYQSITPTQNLRASDSGVKVGPKAAQVGELTYHYPDAVSPGLAIPFGAFKSILSQPFKDTGLTTIEWMVQQYTHLDQIKDNTENYNQTRSEFLKVLREWIENTPLDQAFINELRTKMQQQFGAEGSYGVFVRSDTNVEDLPGFTGAGLNLTVANVVGFENTLQAIKRVWASPFSDRAFGWRQALMDKPEHLYAAVLLHKSVNSEKSGVLVSADIFGNSDDALTVVLNEGVGGGVDGLSAETLVINKPQASTVLQASATAPFKRTLNDNGGVDQVQTSYAEKLLLPSDIEQLISFTNELPRWFGEASSENNIPIADVEFGFLEGKLILFQIRPYLENDAVQRNPYLLSLDSNLSSSADFSVDLTESMQ